MPHPLSLDALRRRAKTLKKAYRAGEAQAVQRVAAKLPSRPDAPYTHADFLHVIAREESFESWPRLKLAAETQGLDRAARQQRLKIALHHGQNNVTEHLLGETPDLAAGLFGLEIALYDRAAVEAVLVRDPDAATRTIAGRRPIHFLAFSRWIHARPALSDDMFAIAEALVAHGADVNDPIPAEPDSPYMLSPLYGALGHAGNVPLAAWLLERGADPNDGESLYHATELGHTEGVRLLLRHGARPAGTNALARALDFNNHETVRLLLEAGADPDEGTAPGAADGLPPLIAALPQAARRLCDSAMIRLLLAHGASPDARWNGHSAYALARIYGNAEAAALIAEAGADTALSPDERLLAAAADDTLPPGARLDPATLDDEWRDLPRALLHLPQKLGHVRRLIRLGLEFDRPDGMGLTPVHIAGWEGLPDAMAYFLSLGPDLDHVNHYGGTLLSTIIHGSENNPKRAERDHVACARLALGAGVALPTRAIDLASAPGMADCLAEWAEAHPGQVIEGGIA